MSPEWEPCVAAVGFQCPPAEPKGTFVEPDGVGVHTPVVCTWKPWKSPSAGRGAGPDVHLRRG